jgi:hypothetical protein
MNAFKERLRVPPVKDRLLKMSAVSVAQAIKDGEVTSEEVIATYINRIREVQPFLNAVVQVGYAKRIGLVSYTHVHRTISTMPLDVRVKSTSNYV